MLSAERKKKLAKLAICHRIAQRITDICRIELEAELSRGIGRTDEEVDDIAAAASIEKDLTGHVLYHFYHNDELTLDVVEDLPHIAGFFGLLPDYNGPDGLVEVLKAVKTSDQCRDKAFWELVPCVPRETPLHEYQAGYEAGRKAEAAARDAAEDLEGWEVKQGSYTVDGEVVEEDVDLAQEIAKEDAGQ